MAVIAGSVYASRIDERHHREYEDKPTEVSIAEPMQPQGLCLCRHEPPTCPVNLIKISERKTT